MAQNKQPILKRCKALGISPAVMGVSKETTRNPKKGRQKPSEYAKQLRINIMEENCHCQEYG